MLIYSSARADNTFLSTTPASYNAGDHALRRQLPAVPSRNRLLINRLCAFTALVSINACTYFAAHALLNA